MPVCRRRSTRILPRETAFLQRYDHFRRRLEALIDMPDRTIDLLFRFLQQNGGKLSARARAGEFAKLTDAEVAAVEAGYGELFGSGE